MGAYLEGDPRRLVGGKLLFQCSCRRGHTILPDHFSILPDADDVAASVAEIQTKREL